MAHESQTVADMARSADGRDGITSFLEKRAPNFSGE
jgi:enoyl-CoA hydratase/carnithine racemase